MVKNSFKNSIKTRIFVFLVHICGIREFSAEIDVENIIQAPAYPGAYGTDMNCWYKITSPENTRIRFWIDDFGTETFYRRSYRRTLQHQMVVSCKNIV